MGSRSSLLAMMEQRNMKDSSERVGQQDSKLSDANLMAVPSSIKSNNGIGMQSSNPMDIMRRNMLMKSIYDDDFSTRPNPVDVGSMSSMSNMNNIISGGNKSMSIGNQSISSNNIINNSNVFQSFMGQYWEDLPNNMSSSQVVDEIIATFQQPQPPK